MITIVTVTRKNLAETARKIGVTTETLKKDLEKAEANNEILRVFVP